MDMNLSNFWEIVEDRGAWSAAVHEVERAGHDLVTEQQYTNRIFIHSSVDGHFGGFRVLAIVNSALMDMYVFNYRKWQPTPVLLPGKSHGWRSMVGYSPQGCKELDTTE